MLAQPIFGMMQKLLHGRMQKRIQQTGPCAALCRCTRREICREKQRHRSQQMPRERGVEGPAQIALDFRCLFAVKAQHEPACALGDQRTDRLNDLRFGHVADCRDPVTDERFKQVRRC